MKRERPSLAKYTVEGFLLTPCLYCGMSANTRDHFVPRAWRSTMLTWRTGIWKNAPDTVPACSECNSIAGSRPFGTVAGKRAYIHDRLRTKYARLLSRPFWAEQELSELGRTLRSRVERDETKKLRLILRLAWPYEHVEGALVRHILRGDETADALNERRRAELVA